MAFKDAFTREEWEVLQFTELWIFDLVARADGKIDIKEMDAMSVVKMNADKFENDLVKEVLKGSGGFGVKELRDDYINDETKIEAGLKKVCKLLDEKIDGKVSEEFRKTMLAIGFYIGHASGDYFESNLSEEEVEALKKAASYLDLTEDVLKEEPTVKSILADMQNFTKAFLN